MKRIEKWLMIIIAAIAMYVAAGAASSSAAMAAESKQEQVKQLIAVLSGPGGDFEKARACQELAAIGTVDAVPALASLLGDEKLSNYAREGLEGIGGPAAADALRDAIGGLKGKLLVGAINSIGVMRDAKAVGALKDLAKAGDADAAAAAVAALGRIATAESVEFVQLLLAGAAPAQRIAAADACFAAAERLLAAGDRDGAAKLYDAVAGAELPAYVHLAAVRRAMVLRPGDGAKQFLALLRSGDGASVAMALRAVREMPGDELMPAILAEAKSAAPALQAQLIPLLAERKDAKTLEVIEALAGAESAPVRLAAIKALGRVGGSSSVAVLIKAIQSRRSEEEATEAINALTNLGLPAVDGAIVAALGESSPAARATLIAILGSRNAACAADELLKQAQDKDVAVSRAAFVALVSVGRAGDVPRLVQMALACADQPACDAAERAVLACSAKIADAAHRCDALVGTLRETKDARGRCALIRMLAAAADAQACGTILPLLQDAEPAVRDAALRSLADWPNASPADALLNIARSPANAPQRALALRGAIRMAGKAAAEAPVAPAAATAWLTQANELVHRNDTAEKRLILSGLANLNSDAGLELVKPYVDDPAVTSEAALAVIQIAKRLPGDRSHVRSLLQKIADKTKNNSIRQQARELIR